MALLALPPGFLTVKLAEAAETWVPVATIESEVTDEVVNWVVFPPDVSYTVAFALNPVPCIVTVIAPTESGSGETVVSFGAGPSTVSVTDAVTVDSARLTALIVTVFGEGWMLGAV